MPNEQDEKRRAYVPPPETPTQEAVGGIRFDFNCGLRVAFPKDGGRFRLLFRDLDSGVVLYCMDAEPGTTVASVKRYFTRFGIEIYRAEDLSEPVFTHELELKDRDVLVQIPQGALGDAIAWFSYVERFGKKHGCRLHVAMQPEIAEIFRRQYPQIHFATMEEAEGLKPYATYHLGLFFGGDTDGQPFDFREAGLHRTAGHILGLEGDELAEAPPRVDLSAPRRIPQPYAIIATQASSQCKCWNNPSGWRETSNSSAFRKSPLPCRRHPNQPRRPTWKDALPRSATGNYPFGQRRRSANFRRRRRFPASHRHRGRLCESDFHLGDAGRIAFGSARFRHHFL